MKREIKTYKITCDYCGQEIAENKEFIFPVWNSINKYAFNKGSKVAMFSHKELDKKEHDVCIDCQKKIASLLEMVKNATIDDQGYISFKF